MQLVLHTIFLNTHGFQQNIIRTDLVHTIRKTNKESYLQ